MPQFVMIDIIGIAMMAMITQGLEVGSCVDGSVLVMILIQG